jgi:hypothetical protein
MNSEGRGGVFELAKQSLGQFLFGREFTVFRSAHLLIRASFFLFFQLVAKLTAVAFHLRPVNRGH